MTPDETKPVRTGRNVLSWVLFAISAALLIFVGVTWYQDRNDDGGETPPPPSIPGKNEAINVKQALENEGLDVEFVPGGGRSPDLSVAGQLMTVKGDRLFVFIYPQGPEAREEESAELVLDDFHINAVGGTPSAELVPRVFMGSNVIVALFSDSDETAADVQAAIEGLP